MLTESKELSHKNLANPNYDLLELKLIRTAGHVLEPSVRDAPCRTLFLSITNHGFIFYADHLSFSVLTTSAGHLATAILFNFYFSDTVQD